MEASLCFTGFLFNQTGQSLCEEIYHGKLLWSVVIEKGKLGRGLRKF